MAGVNVHDAGIFETKIGGVPFKVRRRTARIMLQIGNPVNVFGQLATAVRNGNFDAEQIDKMQHQLVDDIDKALPIIVVEADGVTVDDGFDFATLDPFAEALFSEFLGSGLMPDPTPPS